MRVSHSARVIRLLSLLDVREFDCTVCDIAFATGRIGQVVLHHWQIIAHRSLPSVQMRQLEVTMAKLVRVEREVFVAGYMAH